MDDIFKNKLYIITALLDFGLLFILFLNNLSGFDNLWILLVLISHGLFYYGLQYNQRKLLDILHYFIFILPSLSIFTNNIFLKILSLLLLLLIQILWIKENRCILNDEDYDFGYGNELNYYVLIFTSILSLNIGYCYFFILQPI